MVPVRIYSTEWCPFCQRAKALLAERGVETLQDIRIDLEPAQRAAMIRETGRATVPQIFIGDTHVGGCDDLVALDRSGRLEPMLAGNGG